MNVPGRLFGSHFVPSMLTSFRISFSSSTGSNAGKAMRVAEVSIRLQFRSGRKSRRRPS